MNKRGFTLIELIIVMAIMLIVASVGSISFLKTQRSQTEDVDEMAIFQLNDSTESYALISGTSLNHSASDFVFSDCKVGGNLSADLMIGKLMENGFLILEPQVQSSDAEFKWDTVADKWIVVFN